MNHITNKYLFKYSIIAHLTKILHKSLIVISE